MIGLKQQLESIIQQEYGLQEEEWVQVDISKRGKVHVTIVTEQQITTEEIKEIIKQEIDEINEGYTIGFVDIYSIEQAKELGVEHVEPIQSVHNWEDTLYATSHITAEDKNQVISFYSYKGGVGRTIALIQTAYNLAKSGKRVMMLDLDIEAPSLHKIFEKEVQHEKLGVKYGIVDYLYRKCVQNDSSVRIDDIYCKIAVEDVSGGLFLIPALKQMDKQYIYNMGMLQTEKIQDQRILADLLESIRIKLDIDIILIDCRAGFNKWGSLSLFAISDHVIFVAYPNQENIEGLNMAFSMMENVGKKKFAVAMSKIVASEFGKEKAKELFAQLKMKQERLIPIYYSTDVALSNTFPITSESVTQAYGELSRYILDNDLILANRNYLKENKTELLKTGVFLEKNIKIRLAEVERFMTSNVTNIFIYEYPEEVYGIESAETYWISNEENVYVPTDFYSFRGDREESCVIDILSRKWENLEQLVLELERKCLQYFPWEDKENVEELLQVQSLEEFIKCATHEVGENNIWFLQKQPLGKRKYYSTNEFVFVIEITEKLLKTNTQQTVENIQTLIEVFDKKNMPLTFKFIIQNNIWEKNQDYFLEVKNSICETELGIGELERIILANVNDEIFETYLRTAERMESYIKSDEYHLFFEHDKERLKRNYLVKLLIGVWKNANSYSMPTLEYLHSFIRENHVNVYDLIKKMKRAANQELKLQPSQWDDDRLISLDNIKKLMEQYQNKQ